MYITAQEFADAIGVCATTIYSWEKRGLIVPMRKTLTNRRYYITEQVQAYLDGKLNDPILKGIPSKISITSTEEDFNLNTQRLFAEIDNMEKEAYTE